MGCKLIKVLRKFVKKDGTEGTTYDLFIVFDNGNRERIQHNEWTDKDKKVHSNRSVLLAFASEELPF